MRIKLILFSVVVLFVAVIILEGCDDTVTANSIDSIIIPSSNVSYSKYLQPVFTIKCATVGCHTDQDHAGGLSLTSYSNTIASYIVVSPGLPQNSQLVVRTQNVTMPPPGYAGLTSNQIAGIKTWVKEGAKNN
jgi:Planctomycete cytochrome C